ncbi:MAG: hypothetical protein BWY17_00194 [Deltaproteobacteria bacterium ADurb.Bin207]|jgi:hypothetical protein|nr:MAG: hypothetical protein BWY17_00194 [Deltaproteobacteria bacterium ADurb.Bin207]
MTNKKRMDGKIALLRPSDMGRRSMSERNVHDDRYERMGLWFHANELVKHSGNPRGRWGLRQNAASLPGGIVIAAGIGDDG